VGFAVPAVRDGDATAALEVVGMRERICGEDFLAENTTKFLEAARKRPEFAALFTTLLPSVPQVFAEVDREKVLKQGIELSSVYQTLQAFMGGYFVNSFNQFGRVWQVYVQAEGDFRTEAQNVGQFYVRNRENEPVPLSTLVNPRMTNGPEFTVRFNEHQAAQIKGILAPGYSTNQGMRALEDVFAQTMPRAMGYDYMGMSFQEKVASEGVPASVIFGLSLLMAFLILAAQYESWSLPFSVLLVTPIGVFGAFFVLWLRAFQNNVFADRPRHAHRALREKRHLDCRVLQTRVRERDSSHRGRARRSETAAAPHSRDGVRVYPGRRAPRGRDGRRRHLPTNAWNDRLGRNGCGERACDLFDPGLVRPGGTALEAQRGERGGREPGGRPRSL